MSNRTPEWNSRSRFEKTLNRTRTLYYCFFVVVFCDWPNVHYTNIWDLRSITYFHWTERPYGVSTCGNRRIDQESKDLFVDWPTPFHRSLGFPCDLDDVVWKIGCVKSISEDLEKVPCKRDKEDMGLSFGYVFRVFLFFVLFIFHFCWISLFSLYVV